jgi:hypothetical protein
MIMRLGNRLTMISRHLQVSVPMENLAKPGLAAPHALLACYTALVFK